MPHTLSDFYSFTYVRITAKVVLQKHQRQPQLYIMTVVIILSLCTTFYRSVHLFYLWPVYQFGILHMILFHFHFTFIWSLVYSAQAIIC